MSDYDPKLFCKKMKELDKERNEPKDSIFHHDYMCWLADGEHYDDLEETNE